MVTTISWKNRSWTNAYKPLKQSQSLPMKTFYTTLFAFLFCFPLLAQDDLLGELEAEAEPTQFEYPAFKAMKIANLQSTKVASAGDLYMYVSHRFGDLKDGVSTFFGLDNANTKIQMVRGFKGGFQVGLSRESFRRTYAASAKAIVLKQTDKMPVAITAYTTINCNTLVSEDAYEGFEFADRLSYVTQLLIARRFSEKFSFLVAPTFVRQNLVFETGQDHNQLAMGVGGRYKVSKRTSLNFEHVFNFSRVDDTVYRDVSSLGIDLETGGHVFQLLFTNAQSTNEPSFISNASGDWNGGAIFFGFNIVRVF